MNKHRKDDLVSRVKALQRRSMLSAVAQYLGAFVWSSPWWLTLLSLSSSARSHSKSLYRLCTQDSFSLKMGRLVYEHTHVKNRKLLLLFTVNRFLWKHKRHWHGYILLQSVLKLLQFFLNIFIITIVIYKSLSDSSLTLCIKTQVASIMVGVISVVWHDLVSFILTGKLGNQQQWQQSFNPIRTGKKG